jgi:dihydrofolate synthase/folylpolyglutamate synthase
VAQTPTEYLFSLEHFGIKLGLDNIRTIVGALGRPDRHYRIVHVAGTNGKGSIVAMVDAAVRAAGHHSGRYTSPHLVHLNERFVIDGTPVTNPELERAIVTVREAVERLIEEGRMTAQPTFFEATTAMALNLFRDAAVDVAVCEVGLGGRLDATNIVEPAVTAISSIGHDHQKHLGATLSEIAAEKAGIIKPGVPVVLGDLPAAAGDVIAKVAETRGAALEIARQLCFFADEGPTSSGGRRLRLRTPVRDYGSLTLALGGAHQIDNALVAVRLLERLDASGTPVDGDAIREGLATVRWPGRLERRTLPDGRDILCDAAHNPEGAQALAVSLASESGNPRALVFAAMTDKDVTEVLRALMPHVCAVVMTRASNPRSSDPNQLALVARALDPSVPLMVHDRLGDALDAAWRVTPRIVVAGSIFLLGDTMKHLGWS